MKLLSKRSFFSSYNEREQFYKSLVVKNTIENTHQCLTRQHPGIQESYQDILYKNLPWGSSCRDVINRLGNPRYKVERLNDLDDHTILFFKRNILNEMAVLQCHFIHNQLYFVHIDFLNSLSQDLGFIHELILKKYLLPDHLDTQTNSIQDCYQNKLLISKDVTLSVTYISGTPSIIRILEKQMAAKSMKLKQKFSYSLSEL